jgi:transglutaminase-like putative cysteine protease
MRLTISHTTRYRFSEPVVSGLQQLRLTPKTCAHQQVLSWGMQVQGAQRELAYTDHHGNSVELISFGKDALEIAVTCSGEVQVGDSHGVLGRHVGPVPLWLYTRVTPRTKAGPGVRALLKAATGDSVLDRAHALMPAVAEAVTYTPGASESHWTAEESLAEGRGVCQDHAHVFIACAREAGWPARYVSGYLMLVDGAAQEAMHAWAEVHVAGLGWVGFDPANGISPDSRYVRVATGLDYGEAAPITGRVIGGAGEALDVAIAVAQQ